MKIEKSHRTVLLSDQPSSEDLFGGSHGLVAEAIAQIVRTEIGGKGIGIEGGWGSGKSTVVNLICDKLKSDSAITTVTFDAWVHQGDNLRRAFLETLIRKLIASSWVDKTEWTKRLNQLAKRVRTSERRTTPTLTPLAKSLAASIALVPIGITLFNLGTRDAIFSWLLVIPGILLALGPVLAFLFLRISKGDDQEDWALLVNKHVTTEQVTVTEDPDPTSIEFRELFYLLMGSALSVASRKVLVVVDNLDRIPGDDAYAIWSLLRTFLESSDHENPDWFSNLWLLIPYDRKSLKALLPKNEMSGEDAKAAPASFVDKSIQVRFYVAPPILSNWRSYLLSLLSKALPDHSIGDPEFNSVYRLYALQAESSKNTPTPRELILYVNDIGALYRQWGNNVRLSHMAFYALSRRRIDGDVIQAFLSGSIPEPAERSILEPDIDASIAILHFNVPRENAREALLKAPIANALALQDQPALKSLASQQAGFVTVLEHVLSGLLAEWVPADPGKYANAARCIVESVVLEDVQLASKQMITQTLIQPLDTPFPWTPFTPDVAIGIACLISLSPTAENAKRVAETLRRTSTQTKPTEITQASSVVRWIEALLKILNAFKKHNLLNKKDLDHFIVPTTPEFWIQACKRMQEIDPEFEFGPYVSPSTSADEVNKIIVGAINAGQISPDHRVAIRAALVFNSKSIFENVSDAVLARICRPDQIPGQEIENLFETLSMLGKLGGKHEVNVQKAVKDGGVLNQLHWAFNPKYAPAIAWGTYLHLRTFPNAQMTTAMHQGQSGHNNMSQMLANPGKSADVVTQFLAIIEKENDFALLLKVFDAAQSSKSFLIQCFRHLAGQNKLRFAIDAKELDSRWQMVRQDISEDKNNPIFFDALVKSLCEEEKIGEQIVLQDFKLDAAGLYASMARAGLTSDEKFVSWCNNGLDAVAVDVWDDAFQKENDLIELLAALVSADKTRLSLGIQYQDGLLLHAKKLIGGGATVKRFSSEWKTFLKPLNDQKREVLQRRFRDAAESADGVIAEQFFLLWGEEIGPASALVRDDRVVASLFTPILLKKNRPGLKWLDETLTRNRDLLDKCEPQTDVLDFKERLQHALATETEPEIKGFLESIATSANVRVSQSGEDKSGESGQK